MLVKTGVQSLAAALLHLGGMAWEACWHLLGWAETFSSDWADKAEGDVSLVSFLCSTFFLGGWLWEKGRGSESLSEKSSKEPAHLQGGGRKEEGMPCLPGFPSLLTWAGMGCCLCLGTLSTHCLPPLPACHYTCCTPRQEEEEEGREGQGGKIQAFKTSISSLLEKGEESSETLHLASGPSLLPFLLLLFALADLHMATSSGNPPPPTLHLHIIQII